MSNLTSVTDAMSRVTDYEYDAFNRRKKITYPPATAGATRLFESMTYDGDGNVKSHTDTAGRVTSYAYDNVNRITGATDTANQTTTLGYDALSRVYFTNRCDQPAVSVWLRCFRPANLDCTRRCDDELCLR